MWACSVCGLTLRRVKYPVYCRCGAVHRYEAPEGDLGYYQRLWRELHRFPFSENWPSEDYFRDWCSRIPATCCGASWAEQLQANPPPFGDRMAFFEWSVGEHNRVNVRLDKPVVALEDAFGLNGLLDGPEDATFACCGVLAVTSVSPVGDRNGAISGALDSWLRAGLQIVAVNTREEIRLLEPKYPQVSVWVEAAPLRRAPSLHSLMRAVKAFGMRAVVLNSDIAIRGDGARLLGDNVTVGIRYNYSGHWRTGEREHWGIDAFAVSPEHVADLPDLELEIGLPMWDYWLPIHFERAGIKMDWVGDPYFFHPSHPMAWTMDDLKAGMRVINACYGTCLQSKSDTAALRLSWPFGGPPGKIETVGPWCSLRS